MDRPRLVEDRIILDLCGGTGAWSHPYKDAGYDVRLITLPEHDVMEYVPPPSVYGILAAPPCESFSRVGARWWPQMDSSGETQKAMNIFRRCFRLCQGARVFWALENPPGRQRKLMPEIPRPTYQFSPYLFGDAWEKQTYLWGRFHLFWPTKIVKPAPTIRCPSGHTQGRIARLPSSSPERAMTPPGFAKAFFEANQ